MYIDSHCHLNSEPLAGETKTIIARALNAGVNTMIVVGWDLASSQAAIALAENYPEIYAVVGFHPCDIAKIDLKALEVLLQHPRVVALGEIGLDYHWVKDLEERAAQKEAFVAQIALANRFQKPIVVHSREAMQDTYDILKAHHPQYGCLLHCYGGSPEMVTLFQKEGCYFSFGGPVTFQNARLAKEVVIKVDNSRLLLETDSPYLTPHPHRGKTNDPSYLPLIAKAVADLKQLSLEEIAQITSDNACAFFHL